MWIWPCKAHWKEDGLFLSFENNQIFLQSRGVHPAETVHLDVLNEANKMISFEDGDKSYRHEQKQSFLLIAGQDLDQKQHDIYHHQQNSHET